MAEENQNHFVLNRVFPNPVSILSRQEKTQEDIFKEALFVLDTNSLLVPYQTGKEDIEKIRKVYERLISEERLFIPTHVLKEFAKNRSTKISELYTNIDNSISSAPTIKSFEYPILGELASYKQLKSSREKFLKVIEEYKENLKELKAGITNWNWSDPVTKMYSATFPKNILIDTPKAEKQLLSEYNSRILDDIPPGNKDKSKDKNAIGDFIIWQTILELGNREKKDVIFITNDEKNDWLLKGNKKSISTKFELIDEFWRKTEGCYFTCMTFSDFLESQGLEIEIVETTDSEIHINENAFVSSGSIEALQKIYELISEFTDSLGTDEELINISPEIDQYIGHFLKSYWNEFVNTDKWERLYDYLFLFNEWLSKINSFNNTIIYQEVRMKRDTRTERLLMISLSEEFLKKYTEFEKLI